jgi:hypothetical protein
VRPLLGPFSRPQAGEGQDEGNGIDAEIDQSGDPHTLILSFSRLRAGEGTWERLLLAAVPLVMIVGAWASVALLSAGLRLAVARSPSRS